MSAQIRREPIWKPITKNQLLPKLQRRIFLNLAQNDPQNINETAKAVKGHYKSTHTAFKALVQKGLIKKVTSERKYPCYWIAEAGAFVALLEGVKSATLLEKTLKIYPDNEDLHCLLETSLIVGTDAYNIALSAILRKGKLEPIDISTMMAQIMLKELSLKEARQFITILKKYPKYYRRLTETTEQFRENIQLLDSILQL
jgi:DNA-binding MarR family transcriptional regulator